MINDKMKIIAEQQSQRVVLKGETIKDNNTIYSVKSPFTFKGRNLINYKTTYDNTCFELVGNTLKNIIVDQRQNDRISFSIYSWAYGSVGSLNVDRNGRFAIELHPTQSGEYNFYHSGSSTNIYITKFYLVGGETYTLSLDIISHDSRVVGGFEVANIQLEKGNQATPYLAYDNQLTYIRTKRVDLGTLNFAVWNATYGDFWTTLSDANAQPSNQLSNIKCGYLTNITGNQMDTHTIDKSITLYISGTTKYLRVRIQDFANKTAQELKQALSGTILEYETAEPLELNGIGTNYDTFENTSGKVVRKIRKVKINDLNWSNIGTEFRVTISNIKSHSGTATPQILCTGYGVTNLVSYENKNKVITQSTKTIMVKDSSYLSVADFKSAKGNEYIYYIMATSDTENERSVLVDHRYNKVVDSNGNEIDTD